ncbi:kinesin-like protein KIF15 [Ischnura elegans]|uniref:kinesin-like protein KIF15 n=1 Tax=Ischnura elegans TaxID=197161 RepID=UPI001ED8B31C|nr:kinesin-like protein KIF15 [Ischnura elegans]
MMGLHLPVLLLGILAGTQGAPYHQGFDHYDQLAALGDETEQFQQNQEHEDILGNLQQQYQSEDLQQFQQNPFLEEHLPAHLEDFSQHAQRLEQNHANDDYVQQPQALNIERFPEPHGQLREAIPEEDYSQHAQRYEQNHQNDDYVQQPQTLNIERFPEPHGQLREAIPDEDDTQQFQPIEFNQYQQGPIPELPQSGRLEIGHDDVQEPQGHETNLREFEQQSQSEDLSQYTQQQDQVGRLMDELNQVQDHDRFIDDTQQQSQVEDLTQFQQGKITDEHQSGRLEDLSHDVDVVQQTQEKQIADIADYPEEIGQIRVHEDDAQQTRDHDSFIDDSHQQSQVEDLSQFQQGRITSEQQSGRLEDLAHDADMLQQTQEKQIGDLSEYPEQIGQIRVHEDDTQQTQDHDSFIDDSHQQSQVEDLSQFQQGRIEQQIGRLEDLGEHADTQQQNEEKLIEELNHEDGQQRQDVYAENYADLHGGMQQETQNEDLSAFSMGQFRVEPNVKPLEVSQLRHEQNELSFNVPDFAAKVESEDVGRSSHDNEDEYPTTVHEEIHQQAPVHPLHSELDNLDNEKHFPSKPGFWKRLGSKIESVYDKVGAKIESAYEKAKEKGRHAIHRIQENLG